VGEEEEKEEESGEEEEEKEEEKEKEEEGEAIHNRRSYRKEVAHASSLSVWSFSAVRSLGVALYSHVSKGIKSWRVAREEKRVEAAWKDQVVPAPRRSRVRRASKMN
jgi:hypothetical protein